MEHGNSKFQIKKGEKALIEAYKTADNFLILIYSERRKIK